jgi:predicted nuclease of predicted toxin-antitoxin system
MKLLLDECLPRKLRASFSTHDCQTVPQAGLAGKRNGELLSLAEQQSFDVLVTVDKGIEYEQNLAGRKIAILVLRSRSNQLSDPLPLVPECLARLDTLNPGEILRIGG